MKKKLIIVGIPGSGVELLYKYIKGHKPIKYFTNAPETEINDHVFKNLLKYIDIKTINEIYENNFYINMYNSIYNKKIFNEGIDLDSWDVGDFLITTPFEFNNLPINIIKESYIVWVDCTLNYIKNNIQDINIYNDFLQDKALCIDGMYNILKELNYVYLLNEPIGVISAICNIILEDNDKVNNMLIKGFK